MKTRVIIVDDHASVRDMLAWLLRQEESYEVIGEAGSGIEALRICEAFQPDMLILDLILPCISGVEVLRRVRKDLPYIRVLVFSGTCDDAMVMEALAERPHGYVEKLEKLGVLREAIAAVSAGGCYFSPAASRFLRERCVTKVLPSNLSCREREVLQMVAEGRSSKQISGLLNVAVKTVENHRANLMAKLNLHNVASLTRYATSRGIVAQGNR